MKITLELERWPEDVGGRVFVRANAAHPDPRGESIRWRGGTAEVTIFGSPNNENNDEVTLTGSLHDVREALREALSMLDTMEMHFTEQIEDYAGNAVACPVCGGWVDSRAKDKGHPDGQGDTCLGDGTVLIAERETQYLIVADGLKPVRSRDIKRGMVFQWGPDAGDEEVRVVEALDDAHVRLADGPIPHGEWVVRVARVKSR